MTFVNSDYLFSAAIFFLFLTVIVVSATFKMLHKKMQKEKLKKAIEHSLLDKWIRVLILDEEKTFQVVPGEIDFDLNNETARQLVIDELVKNKGSFVGVVSSNIVDLYQSLGLNKDSVKKLKSTQPNVQCEGIHELCVMEQKSEFLKIYRLTNSKNTDVRIEAQSTVVTWFGFKGLRFLDVVSFPITEFQQLKLLEILRTLSFSAMPSLNNWLSSSNDTVVHFALKLVEQYKQQQVLDEVEKCLNHRNEAVRVQAVKSLVVIGNSNTANLLTSVYQKERFTNRLNILNELKKIAGDEQRDFLIVQLHEAHEYLKLAAARVLLSCTTDGMEILEAKSYFEPDPYHNIFKQVKYEAQR